VLHAGAVPSFAVSIVSLSLFQGLLVAVPAAHQVPLLARLRSGVWALIPLAALLGFIVASNALAGLANGLTWLSLVSVPPLALAALAWAMRGARPWLAPLAALLFALAWADRGGLAGETAGVLLDGLSAVTLGVLLAAVAPAALVKLGIVAASIADVVVIATNTLQKPNNALAGAAPPVHLPQLQLETFGRAILGYEDLFVAALLGALLAAQPRRALSGAALVAALALCFDLLFFAVSNLPATVPVAVALLVLELLAANARRRSRTLSAASPPEDPSRWPT
jgi:hypothetical protein